MTPLEHDRRAIKRALISVYDKGGLVELATALHEAGVAMVSTGRSAAVIAEAGLPVRSVEDVTRFPECLDGRVKTLHPRIHAGILADTTNPDHLAQLADLEIEAFDLVVSNLYPFTQSVASGASQQECIEQIDIGGPSMVRAAAKNHASVAVVTDPASYDRLIEAVRAGGFTLAERQTLAAQAFTHTASYDVAVASWMGNVVADTSDGSGFPAWTGATWQRRQVLRYGENPHQRAALYTHWRVGLASAEQLHGKEMSYNNYVDTDAAVRAAYDHDEPAVAIIKHANPCGIAAASTIDEAYRRAFACDSQSAYGGVVAANRTVNAAMAEAIRPVLTEVVVAPDYDVDALEILRRRKTTRVLRLPQDTDQDADQVEFRGVSGGVLMQTVDRLDAVVEDGGDDPTRWRLVSGVAADADVLADLAFAWRTIRAVKSNAILLVNDLASVGVGMGQVNRVDAARLAVARAGADRAAGSVAASDAYFPFADGLQVLLEAGVRAVVAPGGSIRDAEVIAAATDAGVTMYFTGTRHFAH